MNYSPSSPSPFISASASASFGFPRRVYTTDAINVSRENLYSKGLGSYLAGLFEGDGHISISKPGSKVQNLSLSITFHIKELPLAERLKDIVGFG